MIIAAWVVLLIMLTYGFNGYLERKENPNRNPQSSVSDQGVAKVVLQRNARGHYVASGRINGVRVSFLLDTGATDVAVSEQLAGRLNLRKGAAALSRTANGTVRSWSTILDEVQLGSIRMQGVRASILPGMAASEVLLGMSFLKNLEWLQRGDELTLRQF
ncbi:MAG: TIGR02281 family clan AA aspartic protease [Gammaproteobacteria bacterium]|nr:TIGR02281 family clan AA aspartic protease [Gammaproteobacteria bacterium]